VPPRTDELARVDLFQSLTPAELRLVVEQANETSFAAGDMIAVEGRGGSHFHLILDGTAQITVHGEDRGKRGPGDYFGEIAVIDGGPRSATIVAETPLHTLSIAAYAFRELLQAQPKIAFKVALALCAKLRAAETASTH
jgi:CRP-like cAMP-binding protein